MEIVMPSPLISEETGELRIESVRAVMPKMKIYVYFSGGELGEIPEVSYGEEKLQAKEPKPFEETGEGISYYLLLDISASYSPSYFSEIKDAVLQFQQSMGEEDDLTLITFGDEVEVLCQNILWTDNITQRVQELSNEDGTTLLFQAVKKTAELADKQKEKWKRKAALVITDGEDFSQNTATQEEALASLREKSIPLYALAVGERNQGQENPYINSMGEFARSSGGIMEVFEEGEAWTKINGMRDMLYQADVIEAEAPTNHISYQSKPLTLNFGESVRGTIETTAPYHKKDKKKPVAEVKKRGDQTLEITFSESVQKAEQPENYRITVDKKYPLAVYTAEYAEEEGMKAILTFEEKLANGTYNIAFQNITDSSMEENPLTKACTVRITDGVRRKNGDSFVQKNQGIIAGGIIGLAVLIAAGLFWRAIKKRKVLASVEGKAVLQSNVEKKYHVAVEKKKMQSRTIYLELEGAAGKMRSIEAEVEGSLFVGRSEICDIYIEDEKMSRQHFVLYASENGVDIEDLGSRNGTLINGTRIYKRTALAKGDKIKAGEMQMIVRW